MIDRCVISCLSKLQGAIMVSILMSVIFSFLISSAVCFVFFRKNMKKQCANNEQSEMKNPVNENTYTFAIPPNKKYTLQNFCTTDKSFMNLIQQLINKQLNNNFFILMGKTGSGKTHLLHAIGNRLIENNASMNIRVISAESYTTEFINSIENQTLIDFKNKYRILDALFIDNFESLYNKESTQEELYYTLVSLLERKAFIGIAITSPCDINKVFGKPLASLLQRAVIIEIPELDVESKRAIIARHLFESNLSMQSIDYTQLLEYDVPEMLGNLNKLIAIKELGEMV